MTCLTSYITLRSGDVWFHLHELSVFFILITFYVYFYLPLSSPHLILCDQSSRYASYYVSILLILTHILLLLLHFDILLLVKYCIVGGS